MNSAHISVHLPPGPAGGSEPKEKKEEEPKKIQPVGDDEYLSITGEKNYYFIAHTIKEEVKEQASIMVNGKLKEYQIKARYIH